jgi:hypothetical protein
LGPGGEENEDHYELEGRRLMAFAVGTLHPLFARARTSFLLP